MDASSYEETNAYCTEGSGKRQRGSGIGHKSQIRNEYQLKVRAPVGYYVKEARYGQTDVLNESLRIRTGDRPEELQVILSNKVAELVGVLTDAASRPVSDIDVVLIPAKHRTRFELFTRAVSDADGRFSFKNIAPDEYQLFVWESIEPFAWFDPEVLKQYENQQPVIRVTEASTQVVTLRTIRAAQ